MKKLFEVSNEEHGTTLVVEMTTVDAIAFEEEAQAIVADVVEMKADEATAEYATEQVTGLTAMVADGEQALEEGEVSKAAARMSVTALGQFTGALGLPVDGLQVSHESADTDPAMTLKVSVEGAKEVIAKAIEAVKKIFAKINKNVRKIVAKVIVATGRFESVSKSLIEKLTKEDFTGREFTEDVAKKLGKTFAVANGISGEKDYAKAGLTLLDESVIFVEDEITGTIATVIDGGVIKNPKLDIFKTSFMKGLENEIKDEELFNRIKNTTDDSAVAVVYKASGDTINVFISYTMEKDGKIKYLSKVVSLSAPEASYVVEKSLPSTGDIEKYLNEVLTTSEKFKALNDKSFEGVDIAIDVFEKTSKSLEDKGESATDAEKAVFELAKIGYTKSPKLAFGAIMAIYGNMKAALTLTKEVISTKKK